VDKVRWARAWRATPTPPPRGGVGCARGATPARPIACIGSGVAAARLHARWRVGVARKRSGLVWWHATHAAPLTHTLRAANPQVFNKTGKVVVTGANMKTKHVKGQGEEAGQITKKEYAIHHSNVMHYSKEKGVRSRVGKKIKDDGTKVRYLIKTGEELGVVTTSA